MKRSGEQTLFKLGMIAVRDVEPKGFEFHLQLPGFPLEDLAFANGRRETFSHVGHGLCVLRKGFAELLVFLPSFLESYFQLAVFNI